jgi:hypothetical protein
MKKLLPRILLTFVVGFAAAWAYDLAKQAAQKATA